MGADAAVPWAYVPSETDGASDEDFCDYFQKITSQGNALSCTFGYSSELQNGLFTFFVYRPAQNAIAQYLRIAYRKYLPDNEGGNA